MSTSIHLSVISKRIIDSDNIFIGKLTSTTSDSSSFLIIRRLKGKRLPNQVITLFTRNQYLGSDQYYAIGEYGRDTLDIIAKAPMNEKSLEMYKETFDQIMSIYRDHNIERSRKRYIGLLFKLIDADFLKHDALYELSNPSHILYNYSKKVKSYNSYSEPDKYSAVTAEERRKILDIFEKIDNPSFYEWNMCKFFIGYYDNELKSHIYKLIKRNIDELEKDKYFVTQTGSMFAILRDIENNRNILGVINDFFNDNNVYVNHTTKDYLKRIMESQ